MGLSAEGIAGLVHWHCVADFGDATIPSVAEGLTDALSRCRRCERLTPPDIDTHSLPALSDIISPWRRREIHNRTPNVGMLRS